MSNTTVARRYANALADVVIKNGESEPVKTELKTWEEMMTSNKDLFQVFLNPSIAHLSKEKVLEDLLEKSKPTKTTANFLRILLRNSRLTAIGEINSRFQEVLDERGGLTSARVISARPMTDGQKGELQENLAKLTGMQVTLDFTVDESIIGGVITRVGSTVYDSSVKTQLVELRNQLVNG